MSLFQEVFGQDLAIQAFSSNPSSVANSLSGMSKVLDRNNINDLARTQPRELLLALLRMINKWLKEYDKQVNQNAIILFNNIIYRQGKNI